MDIPKINERVLQLIDYYTDSNVKKFAESIEMPQQTVNRLFNIDRRTEKYPVVTTELLVSITEMYVEINPDWLLTGKGEMLRNENPEQAQEMTIYNRDPRDIAMIELQSKQIALLEDKVRLLEHNANPFDTSNFTRVPSVPYNQDAAYADRDKSPKRAPKEPQK